MKSTSFVRRIDEAGRIVLPKELRKKFNLIENESSLEFFLEEDAIILKKYEPSCMFCHSTDNMVEYHGVKICKSCLNEMNLLSNR